MEPLVPAEVDLRDFGFMPLDVRRLLTSETWIEAADTPKVGHAAMCLWAESWHQLPAASLPDNDRVLARLAMCDPRTWAKLKQQILSGWVKCDDGLLYHPVVAEKALESWKAKLSQRERTRAATEAREAKRRAQQIERDVHRNDERNELRNVERDVHQGTVKGQGREEKNPPNPPAATGGKRRKSERIGYPAFVQACRDAGDRPIPADDPIFGFADDARIPREFIALAWRAFAAKHRSGRKQQAGIVGWRAHFRDAVRGNWAKLWYFPQDGGEAALTTVGIALIRERDAEQARKAEQQEAA